MPDVQDTPLTVAPALVNQIDQKQYSLFSPSSFQFLTRQLPQRKQLEKLSLVTPMSVGGVEVPTLGGLQFTSHHHSPHYVLETNRPPQVNHSGYHHPAHHFHYCDKSTSQVTSCSCFSLNDTMRANERWVLLNKETFQEIVDATLHEMTRTPGEYYDHKKGDYEVSHDHNHPPSPTTPESHFINKTYLGRKSYQFSVERSSSNYHEIQTRPPSQGSIYVLNTNEACQPEGTNVNHMSPKASEGNHALVAEPNIESAKTNNALSDITNDHLHNLGSSQRYTAQPSVVSRAPSSSPVPTSPVTTTSMVHQTTDPQSFLSHPVPPLPDRENEPLDLSNKSSQTVRERRPIVQSQSFSVKDMSSARASSGISLSPKEICDRTCVSPINMTATSVPSSPQTPLGHTPKTSNFSNNSSSCQIGVPSSQAVLLKPGSSRLNQSANVSSSTSMAANERFIADSATETSGEEKKVEEEDEEDENIDVDNIDEGDCPDLECKIGNPIIFESASEQNVGKLETDSAQKVTRDMAMGEKEDQCQSSNRPGGAIVCADDETAPDDPGALSEHSRGSEDFTGASANSGKGPSSPSQPPPTLADDTSTTITTTDSSTTTITITTTTQVNSSTSEGQRKEREEEEEGNCGSPTGGSTSQQQSQSALELRTRQSDKTCTPEINGGASVSLEKEKEPSSGSVGVAQDNTSTNLSSKCGVDNKSTESFTSSDNTTERSEEKISCTGKGLSDSPDNIGLRSQENEQVNLDQVNIVEKEVDQKKNIVSSGDKNEYNISQEDTVVEDKLDTTTTTQGAEPQGETLDLSIPHANKNDILRDDIENKNSSTEQVSIEESSFQTEICSKMTTTTVAAPSAVKMHSHLGSYRRIIAGTGGNGTAKKKSGGSENWAPLNKAKVFDLVEEVMISLGESKGDAKCTDTDNKPTESKSVERSCNKDQDNKCLHGDKDKKSLGSVNLNKTEYTNAHIKEVPENVSTTKHSSNKDTVKSSTQISYKDDNSVGSNISHSALQAGQISPPQSDQGVTSVYEESVIGSKGFRTKCQLRDHLSARSMNRAPRGVDSMLPSDGNKQHQRSVPSHGAKRKHDETNQRSSFEGKKSEIIKEPQGPSSSSPGRKPYVQGQRRSPLMIAQENNNNIMNQNSLSSIPLAKAKPQGWMALNKAVVFDIVDSAMRKGDDKNEEEDSNIDNKNRENEDSLESDSCENKESTSKDLFLKQCPCDDGSSGGPPEKAVTCDPNPTTENSDITSEQENSDSQFPNMCASNSSSNDVTNSQASSPSSHRDNNNPSKRKHSDMNIGDNESQVKLKRRRSYDSPSLSPQRKDAPIKIISKPSRVTGLLFGINSLRKEVTIGRKNCDNINSPLKSVQGEMKNTSGSGFNTDENRPSSKPSIPSTLTNHAVSIRRKEPQGNKGTTFLQNIDMLHRTSEVSAGSVSTHNDQFLPCEQASQQAIGESVALPLRRVAELTIATSKVDRELEGNYDDVAKHGIVPVTNSVSTKDARGSPRLGWVAVSKIDVHNIFDSVVDSMITGELITASKMAYQDDVMTIESGGHDRRSPLIKGLRSNEMSPVSSPSPAPSRRSSPVGSPIPACEAEIGIDLAIASSSPQPIVASAASQRIISSSKFENSSSSRTTPSPPTSSRTHTPSTPTPSSPTSPITEMSEKVGSCDAKTVTKGFKWKSSLLMRVEEEKIDVTPQVVVQAASPVTQTQGLVHAGSGKGGKEGSKSEHRNLRSGGRRNSRKGSPHTVGKLK